MWRIFSIPTLIPGSVDYLPFSFKYFGHLWIGQRVYFRAAGGFSSPFLSSLLPAEYAGMIAAGDWAIMYGSTPQPPYPDWLFEM